MYSYRVRRESRSGTPPFLYLCVFFFRFGARFTFTFLYGARFTLLFLFGARFTFGFLNGARFTRVFFLARASPSLFFTARASPSFFSSRRALHLHVVPLRCKNLTTSSPLGRPKSLRVRHVPPQSRAKTRPKGDPGAHSKQRFPCVHAWTTEVERD